MTSTNVSLMETIRRRCPLLCERMSPQVFIQVLAERNIRFDETMLERAVESGSLLPLETDEGPTYTRGHLLVAYQLSRHSRIEWFPWDDQRPDRDDLLWRRIEAKRAMWAEIESDAECVRDFYTWFGGADVGAFPASTAVRLTEIVRWSIRNIDASGHLFEIARANPDHRGNGSLLLISEMVKLRSEVEQLLRSAAEAGMHIPSASEVARDRDKIAEETRATDEENPLYATPPAAPDADAEAVREKFVAERDLHIRTRDWGALAALFEGAQHLFDGDRGAEVAWHTALATLYGEHLEVRERAAQHWRAVLARRPGDGGAITAIEPLLEREQWAALLAEQVDAVEAPELADALVLARASVLATELGRTEEALEAFGRALAGGESTRGDAAAVLEHIVREGQAEASFDVIAVELLATLGDLSGAELDEIFELVEARDLSADQAAELLLSRAELAEQAGERHDAFIVLSRAISKEPTHATVLDTLERLAASLGNHDELIALLEDELDRADDDAVRGTLAARLGPILAGQGRAERAVALLELAHAARPDERELVMQLAELEQELGHVAQAIAWLEKLRALATDPAEQKEISEVLAELRTASLEAAPREALDVYAKRIRDDEADAEAIAGLLKLARADDAELAAEAARLIDPVLARSERVDELVDIYSRLVDHGAGLDNRAMLERLCQILVRDPARKRLALRRHAQLYALRADPATLASARSIMSGRDDFALWAIFVQDTLERAEDVEVRAKLLRQLARTYQEQLRDFDAAATVWRKLLELRPDDRPAFQALQRRYTETSQWQALVDLELGWAEAVVEDKRATLLEVARVLADQLHDTRGAYMVYEQLQRDAPGDAEVHAAVEALLERTDSPESRLELLEEVEASAEGERWLALRMSRVNATAAQGSTDEAILLVRELLERSPGHATAIDRLESLLRGAERWDELASLLESRVANATGDAARSLTRALAALLGERLGRGEEARAMLERVAAEERDVAAAVEAQARGREAQAERLDELEAAVEAAVGAAERVRALIALSEAMEEGGAAHEALARLQQVVSGGQLEDPKARAWLLVRMGQIAEGVDELTQAEALFKSALALQSSDVRFIDPLIGHYRRQRILPKLYALLKFRQSRTREVSELAGVLAELANVAQQLGDLDAAADALENLLELSERGDVAVDAVAVRRNIAGLFARRGRLDDALAELGELADELRAGADAASRAALADVLADLAALHHTTGGVEAARALLAEGLALAPGHTRLSLLHVDALIDAEALDEAVAYTTAQVERGGGAASVMGQSLARLGRLFASRGERERAETLYRMLQALEPRNSEAVTFLGLVAGGSPEARSASTALAGKGSAT